MSNQTVYLKVEEHTCSGIKLHFLKTKEGKGSYHSEYYSEYLRRWRDIQKNPYYTIIYNYANKHGTEVTEDEVNKHLMLMELQS